MRNFRKGIVKEEADGLPPSEAWLFAQALLGKAVPSQAAAAADARAKREQLEWLASISTRHACQFRSLQSQEAEARAEREQLEWLASISSRHERQLRNLLAAEAEARQAHERLRRFTDTAHLQEAEWDPAKHPRGGFTQNRGWFSPAGAPIGSASTADRTGGDGEREVDDRHRAPPEMLELADAWWQTSSLIKQYRRDIEKLPARIADEQAKLRSGDGHSNVHAQNLAKAQRDLERAKALVPQLEAQLHKLEQEYTNAGYDKVDYWTWTPGETQIGGRGIEEVGRAVQLGGSPAGLKPTGVEFDIALTVASVLQLGRWALRKTLSKALSKFTGMTSNAVNKTISPQQHILLRELFKGGRGIGLTRESLEAAAELARRALANSATSAAQRQLHLRRLHQIGEALKKL